MSVIQAQTSAKELRYVRCDDEGRLTTNLEATIDDVLMKGETAGGVKTPVLVNTSGELLVNLGSATTQNVNLIANDGTDGSGVNRVVGCNSNGFLKVKDDELETNFVQGLFSTQMMGRTTITDTATRKNLLCDTDGHLQVDVVSGGGGGTQFAGGNALVATGTGTAMIGRDSGNVARLVATDTSGHIEVVSSTGAGIALESAQTTGNASLSSMDGKITACNTGAVVVSSSALPSGASTETTLSAMSAKLPATLGQKANANCISTCRSSTAGAYDLSARTTIGSTATSTNLLCDADGHLQVDIVSGGGGGSSATNLYPALASITTATNFAGGVINSAYIDLTNAKNVFVNCIHTGNATARTNFGSDVSISMEFTDDSTNTVCYSGASNPAFAFPTIQADGTTTGVAVAELSLGNRSDASGAIKGKFARVSCVNNDSSGTGTAYAVDFKVVIDGI